MLGGADAGVKRSVGDQRPVAGDQSEMIGECRKV